MLNYQLPLVLIVMSSIAFAGSSLNIASMTLARLFSWWGHRRRVNAKASEVATRIIAATVSPPPSGPIEVKIDKVVAGELTVGIASRCFVSATAEDGMAVVWATNGRQRIAMNVEPEGAAHVSWSTFGDKHPRLRIGLDDDGLAAITIQDPEDAEPSVLRLRDLKEFLDRKGPSRALLLESGRGIPSPDHAYLFNEIEAEIRGTSGFAAIARISALVWAERNHPKFADLVAEISRSQVVAEAVFADGMFPQAARIGPSTVIAAELYAALQLAINRERRQEWEDARRNTMEVTPIVEAAGQAGSSTGPPPEETFDVSTS